MTARDLPHLPLQQIIIEPDFGVSEDGWPLGVVRVAACVALLLGMTVLAGWQLRVELLKTLVPGLTQMKANTAVAFVLFSISLGTLGLAHRWRWATLTASSLSVLIGLLALTTLVEYTANVSLGVDQMLYLDDASTSEYPGRMAPNTAVCLVLLSVALLCAGPGRAWRSLVSQLCACVALITAITAVFGYLLHLQALTGIASYTLMALHTGVGLLAVSIGVLFLQPGRGLMPLLTNDQVSGRVVRALLASVFVVTPFLAFLCMRGQQLEWYDAEFGLAIFALSQLTVITVVVLSGGSLLLRSDMQRIRAERTRGDLLQQLREAAQVLEYTVATRTAELTSSKAQLSLVLDNAPALIGYVDTQLRYRFCNNTYVDWYGVDPQVMVGRSVQELVGEAAWLDIGCHYEEALGGSPTSYERVLSCGSAPRDILVELVPEFTSFLQVTGIFIAASDITARKKAEAALAQRESWLRLITDNSTACIGYIDLEQRFRFCNQSYKDWYGLDPSSMVGRDIREVVGDAVYREVKQYYEDAVAGKRTSYQRTLHANGVSRDILIDLIPDLRADGQIAGVFISGVDITALRHHAQALQESEERFRSAFDFASIGMALVASEGKFLKVNHALCAILGYSSEELLDLTLQDITHPQDLAGSLDFVSRLAAGDIRSFQTDKRYIDKQGDVVSALLSVSLVHAQDGTPVHFIAQIQDITARKEALEAMQESEERFQLVVRGTHDGIWDWNVASGYCYYSPRYLQLLGYADKEFQPVRGSFELRLHPQDRQATMAALRAHFDRQAPYDTEYRLRTKSGEYRWFHARGQASWDAQGDPMRFTGSLRDITERKHADKQLEWTTALLRQTGRMAKIGGWERDLATNIPVWSDGLREILEVGPDFQPTVEHGYSFYTPEARPVLEQAMGTAISEGKSFELELPYITAKGRNIWVHVRGDAEVRDQKVARIFGTLQDITDRKNAELAVERSRRFLDAVIEAIPQPVFVKNSEHRWVLFNDAFCEMMERDRSELFGKSDRDIFPPQLAERYWAEDSQAFSMTEPLFIEDEIVDRPSGTSRWLIKSKRRVDLADGPHLVGITTDITRQKKTEIALRASEERFRGLTQLSADWFWEQDEQHRFVTQTGGGLISMNITPQRMLGKTRWELPFVGMSETDWAEHRAMLEAHVPFHNLELCRRNDSGELRHISLSGEPVFDTAGQFTGYRGVGRDITARKRIDEALRTSEESHRLLAENSSDMITRLTPEGLIEYASTASTLVLGYAPEELIKRPLSDLIHPEDAEEAHSRFVQAVRDNVPKVVTCRLRRKDARWVWVESSFRAMRGQANPWISQVIGVSRDVDKRVRVTEALNRFQHVLDNTLDMIFIFDAESLRYNYVNLGAAQKLGYSREKLLGMAPWEVRADTTEAEYRASIAPLLNGEIESRQVETVFRRADGTQFPVDATMQLIRRPGETATFIAVIRDATERKKIDRMKNEFVSTISHELRTPLTSIRGSLGLIAGGAVGPLSEQALKLIGIAYNNSERLVRLINDFLDIEKIESGMRFDFQPKRLTFLLEQAIDANRAYADQLDVSLHIEGEVPDVQIKADADRFQQVMTNLLSNGCKFSPSGGSVKVTVKLRGAMAQISVTDHGSGIPQHFKDKIFEKFSQADASDSREKGGTGLGLSIVKTITEKHGGIVTYDTRLGQGTTFHVTFPLVLERNAHPEIESTQLSRMRTTKRC